MKNTKKIELSELFNCDYKLSKYQCLNSSLELLYYDYLKNKNIELQYHNENLMKYIQRQRKEMLDFKTNEEYEKESRKKERLQFIWKCFYRTMIPLSITAYLIASKDYRIHLQSNIYNSYAIINNLGNDSNSDGIEEIDTKLLNEVTNLYKPTEDKFYANSNLFYNLCDETIIADNMSFIIAMDNLDKDFIEIDGTKYSNTGFITTITYTINNKKNIVSTSRVFKNKEEIELYLNKLLNVDDIEINSFTRFNTKSLEDIPTFNKSSKTGKIRFEEPIKLKTKILKQLIKAD